MKPNALDEISKRRIALAASVDPRSLEKLMRGEPVRGMAGARARAALEAAGFSVPQPTDRPRRRKEHRS